MLRVRDLGVVILLVAGCSRGDDPTLSGEFSDDFERSELGPSWRNTGGPYRIVDGELRVAGARNHPLWLRKRLPDGVRVTFDVRSDSSDGDIKFELFGDGVSFAREASYVATGYVVVFGGWHNQRNVIARLDEHGTDRQVRHDPRVVRGQTYRIKAERRGGLLRWWVDDELMLEFDDALPLKGPGHDHFGFNNWETRLSFDNLRIAPLE
jgi:hypothetical protein